MVTWSGLAHPEIKPATQQVAVTRQRFFTACTRRIAHPSAHHAQMLLSTCNATRVSPREVKFLNSEFPFRDALSERRFWFDSPRLRT